MYRIFNAIKKYADKNPIRFHMPGHKGKAFLDSQFNAKLDVTELPFIDNENVVLKAEKDIEKLLSVPFVKFGSDGSTAFILSSVFAVKNFGNKMIISRSSHKSVFNALKICGIEPIILTDNYVDNLPNMINTDELSTYIKEDGVIGALLTCPDYYGRIFNLEKISKIIKDNKKILIVDSAHGAHLKKFNIPSPIDYADIVILSAHKTLSSLNQGAFSVIKNEKLIPFFIDACNIFLTTSPSYLVLASVEFGIKELYSKNNKTITQFIKDITQLKTMLKKGGIVFVENDDYFKLTIDLKKSGLNKKQVIKKLKENNIFAEIENERYILFMFSLSSSKKELNKLLNVLLSIEKSKKTFDSIINIKSPIKATSYLQATLSESELLPLEKAENRIAFTNVGLTPPCYPIIVAGERYNREIIELLKTQQTFGVIDSKVFVLKEEL